MWSGMGSRCRLNLREFLSKPRFLHEIAEHYGVSRETAVFHLRKALDSGQVLVSEAPMFQTIKDSSGNLKKLEGFVYVNQESPVLAGKHFKLSLLKTDNSKRELRSTSHVNFAKLHGESRRATLEQESPRFVSLEKTNHESRGAKLRANSSLVSKLKVSSAKVTSAKSTTSSRLLSSKQYSNSKFEPLLNVEKIRLFQALLKEPLPFLDIRNRFNISRQTITRLVKRGLLTETWGSKGVGLRFKLTSKGKACLKQLEEASKYELKIRESPLTRLKQRTVI
jgi:predicted DNA-binding protein YlxM (UPF0122 family)